MPLRLVGAGLPRTATRSLKEALERLLGGPCYHMHEVFDHPEHVPIWHRAVKGDLPDWDAFLEGYVAAVDWPVSAFWREVSEANPEALVLLSVRDSPEEWWRSAHQTVWEVFRGPPLPDYPGWHEMVIDLMAARFTERWIDPEAAMAAYQRHNQEVRSTVDPDRLLEWRGREGWAPICRALGVPIPNEPFPHTHTTAQWLEQAES